jgi:hypothetical protein
LLALYQATQPWSSGSAPSPRWATFAAAAAADESVDACNPTYLPEDVICDTFELT